jgi:hypothetical protein
VDTPPPSRAQGDGVGDGCACMSLCMCLSDLELPAPLGGGRHKWILSPLIGTLDHHIKQHNFYEHQMQQHNPRCNHSGSIILMRMILVTGVQPGGCLSQCACVDEYL